MIAMFALDTNLLIYAHNQDSIFNDKASEFIEKVMNDPDDSGELPICLPSQVITEFINVITRQNSKNPVLLENAISIVQDYINTGIRIIHQTNNQISTLLELLGKSSTRKTIFDIALVATLKDNNISGLYTANVKDFEEFDFLKIINPLEQ
ncbi:PIN domain-containing protein [candidate division KSB1 bacterium]|nr:PIN domain-containing protein [candidate division KSB1 bacterium]